MKLSTSHIKGILFAIAGYVLWTVTDGCTKIAGGAGIPAPEIVTFSGLIGMSALLLKARQSGGIRSLRPHKLRYQLASAGFSIGINLFNVAALKHLPFILFFIIAFTAPMMVVTLAALTLGEKLTRGKVAAVIAGFIGVVIAINPLSNGNGLHGDWIGYTTMLCAVFCFSCNMVLQRRIMQTETPDSLAFMQCAAQVAVCGTLMLFSNAPLSLALFLLLCGSGIANIVGNLCSMTASQNTTAVTIAQFHYTQIISGALLGFLIWHEVPNLPLFLGSAIIIASGIYIANHMRKADLEPTVKTL